MREKEKVCGTCKYHKIYSASFYEVWICDNEDSDYYAMESEYDDACDEWEEGE